MEKTRPTSKLEEMGWMFAGLSSVFVVGVCLQQLM